MRVISILNFKGGIGKTSVTVNLADALRKRGKICVIVDADRQSNATTTLLGQRTEPSLRDFFTTPKMKLSEVIYETGRDGLYIIPSDTDLDHVSTYFSNFPRAYYKMRDGMKELEEQSVDYIFIDHAGAYTKLMGSLLESSHEMIIPCILEPYSVIGLRDLFDKLNSELEGYELKNSGIIPYNIDMSKSITSVYLSQLKEQFGDLILAAVRTDTAVMYAQSQKQTVFEYEKAQRIKSKAASDFNNLAQIILNQEVVTA
jgi:chromosome partitioning protein